MLLLLLLFVSSKVLEQCYDYYCLFVCLFVGDAGIDGTTPFELCNGFESSAQQETKSSKIVKKMF